MRVRATRLSLAAVLILGGISAPVWAGGDASFAIRAKSYVDPSGKTVSPAVMVVRDGKIESIASDGEIPDGLVVLDRPDGHLCPGFVDVHVTLGTGQRTGESASSVELNAQAVELFDRHHQDFDRAVRAGVTSVLLAPSSRHLIGGVTAAVKTGGSDAKRRVLGPGPLKISLAAEAFTTSRTPTSLQGGVDDLRRLIAAAKENESDDSAFAQWARGETVALVDTGGIAELSILAAFAAERGVRCVALRANYAAERLSDAKSLGTPIVLGTYEFTDSMRLTRAPALLERAGVLVALTGQPPRFGPEMLRVGAAIAMAQGLDRAIAYSALTTTPAAIAGYTDRIGALAPGMDADFVVYSGDGLDLTSRVLEVFIDGERVYRAGKTLGSHGGRGAHKKNRRGR